MRLRFELIISLKTKKVETHTDWSMFELHRLICAQQQSRLIKPVSVAWPLPRSVSSTQYFRRSALRRSGATRRSKIAGLRLC